MKKTLLVMAAGMGSRYGGNKQIDGMGPNNEVLMLYSVYDAMRAGFSKVVFVIKRDFEERFRTCVGDVVKDKIEVAYAFQDMNDVPAGCNVNRERTKPLGTVQAILSARNLINEPFAVLNADDFYGPEAFPIMAEHLEKLKPENHGCMVGYYLKNTVSENGHVTRGICEVNGKSQLTKVTETYKIRPFSDGTIRDTENDLNGVILNPNALVSMNFFGFMPSVFKTAEQYFGDFLKSLSPEEIKAEYVLPTLVDDMMRDQGYIVDVLSCNAVWFGVTYKEDKPYVQQQLLKMHENGAYPEKLF